MTTELIGALRLEGGQAAVRFERSYATDPADLWSALTEPARLARWLERVSGDLRPGGRVLVHFDEEPARLDVVACEPPTRLVVRWLHDEVPHSEVRAEVAAAPGGSRLVLEHVRLAPAQAAEYAAGWHWHLDALEATLRGEQPEPWSTFETLLTDYTARLATRPDRDSPKAGTS